MRNISIALVMLVMGMVLVGCGGGGGGPTIPPVDSVWLAGIEPSAVEPGKAVSLLLKDDGIQFSESILVYMDGIEIPRDAFTLGDAKLIFIAPLRKPGLVEVELKYDQSSKGKDSLEILSPTTSITTIQLRNSLNQLSDDFAVILNEQIAQRALSDPQIDLSTVQQEIDEFGQIFDTMVESLVDEIENSDHQDQQLILAYLENTGYFALIDAFTNYRNASSERKACKVSSDNLGRQDLDTISMLISNTQVITDAVTIAAALGVISWPAIPEMVAAKVLLSILDDIIDGIIATDIIAIRISSSTDGVVNQDLPISFVGDFVSESTPVQGGVSAIITLHLIGLPVPEALKPWINEQVFQILASKLGDKATEIIFNSLGNNEPVQDFNIPLDLALYTDTNFLHIINRAVPAFPLNIIDMLLQQFENLGVVQPTYPFLLQDSSAGSLTINPDNDTIKFVKVGDQIAAVGAWSWHAYFDLYLVKFTIPHLFGSSATFHIQDGIEMLPPIAKAKAEPTVQIPGQPVHFYDDGSYDQDGGSIVNGLWLWLIDPLNDPFNVVVIGTGFQTSYTWYEIGTYYVQYFVVDDDGQNDYLDDMLVITISYDDIVYFPDYNVEQAIRDAIGKPNGDIIKSDLLPLTSLNLGEFKTLIVNLEGIQFCTNLNELIIQNKPIFLDPLDLSPLSTLHNLNKLTLNNLYNTDISPLSSLTNLEYLDLGAANTNGNIYPLSNLTNLKFLSLWGNIFITDLTPLKYLTNLTFLDLQILSHSLTGNIPHNIEPLSELWNLEYLDISSCNISDISPLMNLSKLSNLRADDNQVSVIPPLQGMVNLEILLLGNNLISDISPLENASSMLYKINLGSNFITDISPLQNLPQLTELYLGQNQINDLNPLENSTNLHYLILSDNNINDISPLQNLTQLTYLCLGQNQINDISPLQNLNQLGELYLGNNQISDISPLQNLTQLTKLYLDNNQISDISPLGDLINLHWLNMSGNLINDISSLQNITQLSYLILNQNQIYNINALEGMTQLRDLILADNNISDIETLVNNSGIGGGDEIDLQNNPLSANSIYIYIPELQAKGATVLW